MASAMVPPIFALPPPAIKFPCKLLQLVVEDIQEKAAQRQLEDEACAVLHEIGVWLQSVTSQAASAPECAAVTATCSVRGAGECDANTEQNTVRLAPGTTLNPVGHRTQTMVQMSPSTELAERRCTSATEASAPAEVGDHGTRAFELDTRSSNNVIQPGVIHSVPTLAGRLFHHKVSKREQAVIEALTNIDEDGSGRIESDELERALQGAGMSRSKARSIASTIIEQIGEEDAAIPRDAWDKALRGDSPNHLHLRGILDTWFALTEHRSRFGIFCSTFMLSCCSPKRLLWDLFLATLLLYIAVALPLAIGFGLEDAVKVLGEIDIAIDIVFLADIILNFRTGFLDDHGEEVLDGRRVALHYIKSWFLIDLVSSFPTDLIAGIADFPTESFKFLKGSKIARVFRFLKFTRLVKLYEGSEIMDWLDDKLQSPNMKTAATFALLFLFAGMLCHWLACIMAFAGTEFLDSYEYVGESTLSRYWCSYYWAMTTTTTVGYGDLTPKTDTERMAAILCMAVGGAYYGYIIGNLVAAVSSWDYERRRYHQRLGQTFAWIQRHKFPRSLNYRMRKYFRTVLIGKDDSDDNTFMRELSPALQRMVVPYLIPQEVRCNGLFRHLPGVALNSLYGISHRMTVLKGEFIAKFGEMGTAMFIVSQGVASIIAPPQEGSEFGSVLEKGDSFGEEFLVGKGDAYGTYQYSVRATSHMTLQCILVSEFAAAFSVMPEVIEAVRANIESFQGQDSSEGARPKCRKRTINLESSPPKDIARTMESMSEAVLGIHSSLKLLDDRVVALQGAVGTEKKSVAL